MNQPQSSPLSDADNLDAVGIRNGGGVDLVITCSAPLDDSNPTIELLARKVRSYAQLASNPNLFQHFDAEVGPVRIFVSCEFDVSDRAKQTLDSLRQEFVAGQPELLLVKDMSHP
jgi:predicted Zn-dependent peptidase